MKPTLIAVFLFAFTLTASAQSKPDTAKVKEPETVTLSLDKLKARYDDVQKARERAVKAKEDAENTIRAIDGALQALQMVATDSTLHVAKPKK